MTAEIIILCAAALFLFLSVLFFFGRGSFLIAGYNTASAKEKEKFDRRKICRAAGFLCFVVSVMLAAMAYFGYQVDSGAMEESVMLKFAIVFVAVILTAVYLAIRYMNTKARK